MIWPLTLHQCIEQHSPKFARWIGSFLSTDFPDVHDLGCGKGEYLAYLETLGFKTFGYEGTNNIQTIAHTHRIKHHDITQPIKGAVPGHVLCIEVFEHIPNELQIGVIDNINALCAETLVLSWAIPGQNGHGHVNCQPAEYVIPLFESMGYQFNEQATTEARAIAGTDRNWFNDTIYIFHRL